MMMSINSWASTGIIPVEDVSYNDMTPFQAKVHWGYSILMEGLKSCIYYSTYWVILECLFLIKLLRLTSF